MMTQRKSTICQKIAPDSTTVIERRCGLARNIGEKDDPLRRGDQRPGDNLYLASVLALDPATGNIKSH